MGGNTAENEFQEARNVEFLAKQGTKKGGYTGTVHPPWGGKKF
jgi:hypothetical protein